MALQVNVRRGIVRLWLALSVAWVILMWSIGDYRPSELLIPPVVLGAILAGAVWIFEGFKLRQALPTHIRRVEIIAKGQLFRFNLPDGSIVTVPSVQLVNDILGDKALASAFHLWATGVNGPLDSLSSHPSIRDYLYAWAIDRSTWLGLGQPPHLAPDDKAAWVTPDRQTVWFWLPDGVSMHELVSIPLVQYMQDLQADNGLLLDFANWMKSSLTREALSDHPMVLAYLRQHTTEQKMAPIVEELLSDPERSQP
jgi:hypothetical protein